MNDLLGRRDEMSRLAQLLDEATQSRGGAVLVRGEPGIGKSALLANLADTADGFLLMRASGAEFESELPYSALHQLCVPVLGHLDALPPPHRSALRIAFGMELGTPDPFLAGAAALGLLLEHDQPLLCLIDDAQWLDNASARALAFVVRRIAAERVAMVFAAREGRAEFAALPVVDVAPLDDTQARALLAREISTPLDERVRARILAETRGNPLALLELSATAGLTGLAGGFDLPAPAAVERSFLARLDGLTPQVRLLLTVAAAEPIGDPGLLWRAAALLGIERDAAQDVPLAEFGTRIRFVHPLARSAVYRAASDAQRRQAHDALARVTDGLADPDRVAWHRARASAGPDEEVATALADSAARAQARGGVAAAAAFLAQAAALTVDPGLRTKRTLAAVEAKLSCGEFDVAADLLSTLSPDDPAVDLLRGRLSFARFRGGDRPTDHLLRAAAKLADKEPAQARACYLDAIEMGILTSAVRTVMDAARTAPPVSGLPGSADVVLDGMVALAEHGHRAAAAILRPVVTNSGGEVWTRWPTLGFLLCLELWDAEAQHDIAVRVTEAGRESGSLHRLPIGLAMLATYTAHMGGFGPVKEMISEGEAIAEATGAAPLVYPRIHLVAMVGRREEAEELFATTGPNMTLSVQFARAVLNNGLADYPAARLAAEQAVATGDLGLAGLAMPELVEATVRCGEPQAARGTLDALTERASAAGTAWGLGIAAYARALVEDDEAAYLAAIEYLSVAPMGIYAARAHLIYGEWLRRAGQRREARAQLRDAHERFATIGAEAFAARAAGELRATGERVRSRGSSAADALTVQEVHIARLVADGATSKEVAAKLFVSPRTVDAHLRNIFRKLDITSRRQLRDLPAIS